MSYDLAVWHATQPITTREAQEVYFRLCEGDHAAVEPHVGVACFLRDLTRSYPELGEWDRLEPDRCPWSAAFDKSEGHVVMCTAFSRADEVTGLVESLAAKHDLVCFNPQGPYVAYPPRIAGMPHLRLTLENWRIIDNPTANEIGAALASLNTEGNSFAVLEVTDGTYIQTALQSDGDYIVEYQDGSPDRHYQAVCRDIARISAAFQAYAVDDEAWKSAFAWRRIAL